MSVAREERVADLPRRIANLSRLVRLCACLRDARWCPHDVRIDGLVEQLRERLDSLTLSTGTIASLRLIHVLNSRGPQDAIGSRTETKLILKLSAS